MDKQTLFRDFSYLDVPRGKKDLGHGWEPQALSVSEVAVAVRLRRQHRGNC